MTLTSLDPMVMARGQPVAGAGTSMGTSADLQSYQRIEAQSEQGEHGHG
jgi:hypothetical protein